MIINEGENSFETADDANIPVDIWLHDNDEDYPNKFVLKAGNYMPRRGRIAEEAYKAICDTREEVEEIINKHILPLYNKAIDKIKNMAKEGRGDLYYWK
jgi:hypothetical protein